MTIKEELKANYKKAIKRAKEREEQKLEQDATDFIEQFIIPEFRNINQKRPTLDFLAISFYTRGSCLYYNTSLNRDDYTTNSPYSIVVLLW